MQQITITGVINGVNDTFTLGVIPAGFLALARNGLLQTLGSDFTLTSNTVTFLAGSIPQTGDTLLAAGDASSAPVPPFAGVPASTIVYAAYRKINVLGAAKRGYSASQGADGLDILNRMLDSWNTEKLVIWAELRSIFHLTPNQQDYQIGPGAPDFDTTRPTQLDRASIIWTPTSSQPLELPIAMWTFQQWQEIRVKSIPTPIPQGVYYETSYPYGVLHYWPYPDESVDTALYVAQQLSQVASLSTNISVPPGYLRALVFNLAVEMADDFPRAALKPMTVQIAADSKAWIKRKNIRPMDIRCDAAVLGRAGSHSGRWNNYVGDWNGPRY